FSFGSPVVIRESAGQVVPGNCRLLPRLFTPATTVLTQLSFAPPLPLLFETMVLTSRVVAVPPPMFSVRMPPAALDAVLPSIVTLMRYSSRLADEGKL